MSLVNADDHTDVFDYSPGSRKNAFLMKGIGLILVGLTLEYSKNADLYIFRLNVCISIVKVLEGMVLLSNENESEGDKKSFFKILLSKFIVAYAILNSVKYIQIIYVCKWINKRDVITMIALLYVLLGLS